MVQIDDAVVRGGAVTLSHLPFRDGQRVTVVVHERSEPELPKRTIGEVRALLKGGVSRFDQPTDPMIPPEAWDASK